MVDQIKLMKTSLIFMAGITIFQTLTIRRLANSLAQGRNNFENLREAVVYLLNIIKQNNIDLTEFDLIALTEIFEER